MHFTCKIYTRSSSQYFAVETNVSSDNLLYFLFITNIYIMRENNYVQNRIIDADIVRI